MKAEKVLEENVHPFGVQNFYQRPLWLCQLAAQQNIITENINLKIEPKLELYHGLQLVANRGRRNRFAHVMLPERRVRCSSEVQTRSPGVRTADCSAQLGLTKPSSTTSIAQQAARRLQG
jgi:hypothetical protein